MNNSRIKYFLFSSQQMKMKVEIEAKIGKKYRPGTVLVNGNYKQFTEISDTPNSTRFPDSIIVASGVLSEMRYTKR